MIAATNLSNYAAGNDRAGDYPSARTEMLFVDLDGTLISTDLLWESLLLALKRDPALALRIPQLLAQGRAALKETLAIRDLPDASLLPYHEEVVAFLRAERARGVRIVLATASHRRVAEQVARHLALFDDVLATEGNRNLKGPAKLEAIQRYCRERGIAKFSYIGDAAADLPIWEQAARIYVVESSAGVVAAARRVGEPAKVFPHKQSSWRAALRALRPHQWAKNLLIFAPLMLAHDFSAHAVASSLLAFIAFSLSASAVYVINDLMDIEADRRHHSKRRRPFAAGTVSIPCGLAMAAGLLTGGVALAAASLPWAFSGILCVYLSLTTAYSVWLKRKLLLDVFMLAGLYTLRIVAGGLATELVVSEWLMAFAIFFFTSLAFAKRYSELVRLTDEGREPTNGRGYRLSDLGLIESVGPASGYIAVLVLAMYINSNAMKNYYAHPWALWAVCPVILYWITRLWFVASRKKLSEDPVVFAMRDGVSRIVGVIAAVLVIVAAAQW